MQSAMQGMRSAHRLLVAGVGCALSLTVSDPALAANKVFATGLMVYSASVNVATSCKITNYGKKNATIVEISIVNAGGPVAATSDTCTTAPLEPGTACSFSGPASSVQGGGTALVKGGIKDLRGNCTLVDAVGNAVQFDQMR